MSKEYKSPLLTPPELDSLIICSVRYAMGRMTYIVEDICSLVIKYKDYLSQNCITVTLRDIRCELKRGNYGMECDLEQWNHLIANLEGLLTDENKNVD